VFLFRTLLHHCDANARAELRRIVPDYDEVLAAVEHPVPVAEPEN
jgi:hypothetical protein